MQDVQAQGADRQPVSIRHETRRRPLVVRRTERLTRSLLRVVLEGEALEGFDSPGFDDHVKVFTPIALGADAPVARDYTPRRHDARAGELAIDFALHEAGPATAWALQAQPGSPLTIGGPRRSFVVPTGFDWHLLVGDETALPAISRRLEELPAGARAVVLAEVDGPEDELAFETAVDVQVVWAHRADVDATAPSVLLQRLEAFRPPEGDGYAWIAGEATTVKALRTALLADGRAQARWTKAAAYWKRGAPATHERYDAEPSAG